LWGADYFRIKNVGHINSQSNLGIWAEGIQLLHQLVRKAKQQRGFKAPTQAPTQVSIKAITKSPSKESIAKPIAA
jgi:arginine decarboxylase-like protein